MFNLLRALARWLADLPFLIPFRSTANRNQDDEDTALRLYNERAKRGSR